MNGIISAVLVGILQAIGWQKLITQVFEDMAYLAAKKVPIESLQLIMTRVGDALKEAEKKE